MKRLTSFAIMMAILLGMVPAAYAAEPELLSRRGEDVYIYRYPGGVGIGLIREDGTVLTEPVYDEIKDYSDGYVQVSRGEKWGLLDEAGKVCIPLEYDYVGPASQGICYGVRNEKYGYLNAGDGSAITEFTYDYAMDFWDIGRVERYEPDGEGNVYSYEGAVDREGKLVVPMEYDYVSLSPNKDAYITERYTRPISELVYYGAYDLEGNLLYPCEYTNKARLLAAIANGGDDPSLVEASSQAAGLEVTWYPDWQNLTRLYGTDRMILVKNNLCALYGLDGTKYTDPVFDAIGEYDGLGQAVAMRNGKWGKIDLNGNTVVDFAYDTQGEAKDDVGVKFVSRLPGEPPYALAKLGGTRLTGYDFWAYRPFINGLAMVTDGSEGWRFIDTAGKAVTEQKYSVLSLNDMKMGGSDFGEDGYAIVYNYQGGYNIIDSQGRELLPAKSSVKPWRAGFGIWGYEGHGGFGFIELATGRVIAEPQFANVFSTGKSWPAGYCFDRDGTMSVVLRVDGELRYFLMDTNGDLTAVERDSETGLPIYPATGETYIPSLGPQAGIQEGWEFHEGLRWVNAEGEVHGFGLALEGPWGFQNEAGELVVPCIYDTVGHFDHGCASVTVNGVYGLLKNPLLEDEDAHKVSGWAAAEVTAATEAGYVTPRCSTYQTRTITRLQFAELAVNYLEKRTGQSITPAPADTFTDTSDETVLKAYAAGIVQGVGEGRFDPNGLLTREQLATMLWRAMEKVGVGMHYGSMDRYTDADQISDWASFAMNNLACHQVLTGTSETTLSPKASCTVEQAILLVYRAKELPGRREQEEQRQAAIDRVTIVGLPIGTPFDQLPQELRTALQFQGETDDFAPIPHKEICKRYTAPGIEIVTSTVLDQVAQKWFRDREDTADEEFLELFGTTDRQTALAQVLGREYVEAVTLTDDTYHMASGLKVGDSEERVEELGYSSNGEGRYSEVMYSLGSIYMDLEGGKVIRIKVYDSIGRRVGPFFDP